MSTIELLEGEYTNIRGTVLQHVLKPESACDGEFGYAADFDSSIGKLAVGVPRGCESVEAPPNFQLKHYLPSESELPRYNNIDEFITIEDIVSYKFRRTGKTASKFVYQCDIDYQVRTNVEAWKSLRKVSTGRLIGQMIRERAFAQTRQEFEDIINANYYSEFFANLYNLVQYCNPVNMAASGNQATFGNYYK